MKRHRIERLTLHHTATRLASSADAPERARSHQAFHQAEGFADLAYHFLVDDAGHILEGRSLDFAGDTFTEYDPTGHLLVCCEGDFDEQEPSPSLLDSVADLLAWGAQTFGIAVDTLAGHRSYAATSCPGTGLSALLEDGTLAGMVAARMDVQMARLDICGEEGVALVGAIEAGQA